MMKNFWKYNYLIIFTFFLSNLSSLNFIGQSNVEYNEYYNIYRLVAFQNTNDQIYSISNAVSVEKPYAIYSPNAFSPDGDGINDFFNISVQGINDFQLEIFNRWGQMVFKSYSSDVQWDGTFKNKDLPSGTYIYKIKTTTYGDKQKIIKSGTISLIR